RAPFRHPRVEGGEMVLATELAQFGDTASIVAPVEFHELIPRTYPYDLIRKVELDRLDAIVVHKGQLDQLGQMACAVLAKSGIPLFGNEVFVVFSLKGERPRELSGEHHFSAFYARVAAAETFAAPAARVPSEFADPSTVI